jgi:hypothetical protein
MAYLGTAWRSSLQIGQSAGTFARGASCTPQALHMCACSARSMSIATVGGLAILQHPADCGVEVQIVEWKFGLWRAVQCSASLRLLICPSFDAEATPRIAMTWHRSAQSLASSSMASA